MAFRKVVYCPKEESRTNENSVRGNKPYEVFRSRNVENNGNGSDWADHGRRMTHKGIFDALLRGEELAFEHDAVEVFEKYLDLGRGQRKKAFLKKGIEIKLFHEKHD